MPLDQKVVETASEAVVGQACPIRQLLPAVAAVAVIATVAVFVGKAWKKKHPKKAAVAPNDATV